MAAGDFKINIGGTIWDFSQYGPNVEWSYTRNVEYFRFPGTNEKLLLDLLDNEETINVSLTIVTSDVTTQLNATSSAGASLRSFMTTVRDTGTDPGDASTLTTCTWHTFGNFTVAVRNARLSQSPGEGNRYVLDFQLLIQSGPV